MTADEFKELDILERLKVQSLPIDHATAFNLFLHAQAMKEENLFYAAFVGAISNERTSHEKNIYTQYFNEMNAKAYTKQLGQSMGGKNGKRSKAKPKAASKDDNKLGL